MTSASFYTFLSVSSSMGFAGVSNSYHSKLSFPLEMAFVLCISPPHSKGTLSLQPVLFDPWTVVS